MSAKEKAPRPRQGDEAVDITRNLDSSSTEAGHA